MHRGQEVIVWFNEVTKEDVPIVGGKGANLGGISLLRNGQSVGGY